MLAKADDVQQPASYIGAYVWECVNLFYCFSIVFIVLNEKNAIQWMV